MSVVDSPTGLPTVRVHRVIARLNVGGPAFHVAHLSAALPAPFSTTLVAGVPGRDEGDMTAYARELGADLRILPGLGRDIAPATDLSVLWSLYRLFRRERPQIVHTHTAKAGTLGRIAAALAGVPVRIHTFHGHVLGGGYFSPRRTRMYLEVERQLARVTSRIVVLSETQLAELAEGLGVAPRNAFRVIPLGLDLTPFRQSGILERRAVRRRALDLPDDSFLIASVGRLVPIKNHELLFQGVARLAEEGDVDPVLLLVGGGEREGELRALAETLGIGPRVRWVGWSTSLPEVLGACDVLALTSKDEGTPVAVIEALAMGLPVVATAVGGVPDLLHDIEESWLTEPGSVDDLVRGLRAAHRSSGPVPDPVRDRVVHRYSVGRLVADIEGLYRAELQRAGIAA